MERGSDKHNPRVDDDLKQSTASMVRGSPVEARAEESREQEGPAEGEPTSDARPSGDDIEARSELARHLPGAAFPGDRDALIAAAKEQHAPDGVLAELRRLPQGRFENLQAVWDALGGSKESRA